MNSEIKPLDVLRAERCHLDEWWEIVGVLLGTRVIDGFFEVYMRCYEELCKLEYRGDSDEAGILKEKLEGLEGKVIGILRTDIEDKPVMVRVDEKQ